jgi:capsular polysaccharide biosynthesis protein
MPAVEVYRALWRRRYIIILLTAIAAVAAYVYSSSQTKVYEASALVRVQQKATSAGDAFGSVNSLEVGQRLAETYAKIVETRSMKQRVADELRGTVPRTEVSLGAEPVGGLDLLRVSASSENPRFAALVANASVTGLEQFIRETGTLRDQIVVVDPATTPDTAVAPRPKTAVAIALMLALLLNCTLALMLEYFADRLPAVDGFEERFGGPVLATVPGLVLRDAPSRSARAAPAQPAQRAAPLAASAPVLASTPQPPPSGRWAAQSQRKEEPRRDR